jgi:sarcosine oxidase subunit beta
LVRDSVELFLNFAEITAQTEYDVGIRKQGYLWVTTDDARAEHQRTLVARQHTWGQTDIEILDGDQVRDRWPYVSRDALQARFRPGDGFLDPKALTLGLLAASRALIVVNSEVTGFAVEGDRLRGVVTGNGTIATDTAVIAAGPFSGEVAALAGVTLPISTVARHKVVLPEVPEVPRDAPMTIDDDTGAHWRPALSGAYVLYTDPTTPPDPPSEDVPPDHNLALKVLDPNSPVSVARVAPFWKAVWEWGVATWLMHSGQYTMTPDHRPLIGPLGPGGLWINTGYSGHGIMGGPAGSRRLVDVLTGTTPNSDNPFNPDRDFVARELDLL